MKKIQSRLSKLTQKLKDEQFKSLKGLGNEIPFYIFDYPAESEIEVRDYIGQLDDVVNLNITISKIDLFDVMLDILEDRGYLLKIFEKENENGTDFLEEALSPILKPENIVEQIKKISKGTELIAIYGIGKVFPLIRSHTILNNLQQVFPDTNVLMFFPGDYSDGELQLFGRLKDDNYYRAFKLID